MARTVIPFESADSIFESENRYPDDVYSKRQKSGGRGQKAEGLLLVHPGRNNPPLKKG